MTAEGRGHVDNGRRNWRLWTASQMFRAARAFEFFTLAIPRPEDFAASTHRFYADPQNVAVLAERGPGDLYPHERALLDRRTSGVGTALVLGCGAGREALGLAGLGWQVVAVDGSPGLVEAAQAHAARSGVRVDWRSQHLSGGFALGRRFDLICLFGHVYCLIPGRARRVQLLRACREHLAPNGICLLDFALHPPSAREAWAHRWRRRLAWLVRGNRGVQLGDVWTAGALFIHQFGSVDEITEEAVAAGLDLEAHADGPHVPMAVLRPASSPAAPAESSV